MQRLLAGIALFALCAAPARAQLSAVDLEGHWLSEAYIDALEGTHSLLRAAEEAEPVGLRIERFGDGHRIVVGNFHEATWHAIARVVPGSGDACTLVVGPYETLVVPSTELREVPATLVRDANGRVESLTAAIWSERAVTFRRLDSPAPHFVLALLAGGSWRDLDGGRWTFGRDGRLTGPDGHAAEAVPSIDTSEACCDYLTIAGTRTGIAPRDGALWMYREFEDPEGCPISCDRTKPLRILVPETAGDASSGAALRRVALAPVAKDGSTWGGGGRRVAVTLRNDGGSKEPDIFPEPPLVVAARKGGARCTIDGGIWTRDGVWLSADETLVATLTYSGSTSELAVYRTADCAKTAEEPVDARTLRVDADRIEHAGICEPFGDDSWDCFPASIWRLRADGTLDHLADESARLTRAVFGVGFDRRSSIEHARTDRARLVPALP